MANDKKPSIYVDRGTIGSSDELDEYGVWVKSEPQDLSSAASKIHETPEFSREISEAASGTDDSDLDSPEIDELSEFDELKPENSVKASEDTVLQDDFDIPELDIEEKTSDEAFDFGEFEDHAGSSTTSDDFIELPEIEDSVKEELEGTENEDSGNEGFTEVSMDDFIGTLDTAPESAAGVNNAVSTMSDFPLEEPVQKESDFMEETVSEVFASDSAGQTTAGKASADLSTQLLMKIAEELSSIRVELSTLKKEFSSIKPIAVQPEETEKRDFFGEEDDEKIALTGDELNNILNTADFTEEAGADATTELSENLDIQEAEDVTSSDPFPEESGIAVEEQISEDLNFEELPVSDEVNLDTLNEQDLDIGLSDTDLVELGSEELGNETTLDDLPEFISGEQDSAEAISAEAISSEVNSAETDVTQIDLAEPDSSKTDAAEPEQIENAEPASPDGFDDFNISLDDESFEWEKEPESTAEVQDPDSSSSESLDETLDIKPDAEVLPDFADEETDELKQIRENGAEPMTSAPAPEDSDYLEEDPLAQEPLAQEPLALEPLADETLIPNELGAEDIVPEISDESIDFSEAVIDEPDLSSEIQDNPLEEPSLEDISIHLDLSELGSDELGSGEEALNVESGEDGSSSGEDLSLIPEGFIQTTDDPGISAGDNEEETVSEEDLGILEAAETAPDTFTEAEEVKDIESEETKNIPSTVQRELKTILSYLDQLLESLPDEKIEEFAKSDYYDTYKKLFKELGLV